jgi:hypothetical protein
VKARLSPSPQSAVRSDSRSRAASSVRPASPLAQRFVARANVHA